MDTVTGTVKHKIGLFAMQPYQKAQVVDLLGTRGIHQLFNGRPRHIQVECITPSLLTPSFALLLIIIMASDTSDSGHSFRQTLSLITISWHSLLAAAELKQ